jgi:hypothetical protein
MKRVLILFVLIMGATLARAQDIAGDWQGTLNTGMGELRLVLHFTKAADAFPLRSIRLSKLAGQIARACSIASLLLTCSRDAGFARAYNNPAYHA